MTQQKLTNFLCNFDGLLFFGNNLVNVFMIQIPIRYHYFTEFVDVITRTYAAQFAVTIEQFEFMIVLYFALFLYILEC